MEPLSRAPCLLERAMRRILLRRLRRLDRGAILLSDAADLQRLGRPSELHAVVRVRNPRFYRWAVLGGSLSVAESYIQGDWDCDDLTSLFRVFVRNLDAADRLARGPARLLGFWQRLLHTWHANSRAGSRRNIGAHYDLGNDFFQLWLDESMAYSCGIFAEPSTTLADASREKFDRACRTLDLQPQDRVLEIGGGWGGFALHAAARYGCHVTTTTISRAQYEIAGQRIDAAQLDDRVTLLDRDYRDLSGTYDKLVSIEMIEAVGHKYLDAYFRKCGELLAPTGSFVLQAIVMPERRHARYLRSVDFIQRYVFPGGCLPSLASILESVGRTTDLRFVHAEDFAPHYARTLRCWRQRFEERLDDARTLGYSEAFLRMWRYYLSYCEALFEERYVGLLQITFDKPACRRDPAELSALAAGRDASAGLAARATGVCTETVRLRGGQP